MGQALSSFAPCCSDAQGYEDVEIYQEAAVAEIVLPESGDTTGHLLLSYLSK